MAKQETDIIKQTLNLSKQTNKGITEKNDALIKEVKILTKKVEELKQQNIKQQEENKILTLHQASLRKTIADKKKGINAKVSEDEIISDSKSVGPNTETIIANIEKSHEKQDDQIKEYKKVIKDKNIEINTLKQNIDQYRGKIEALVTESMANERVTMHLCEHLENIKFLNKQLELNNSSKLDLPQIDSDTKNFYKNLSNEFERKDVENKGDHCPNQHKITKRNETKNKSSERKSNIQDNPFLLDTNDLNIKFKLPNDHKIEKIDKTSVEERVGNIKIPSVSMFTHDTAEDDSQSNRIIDQSAKKEVEMNVETKKRWCKYEKSGGCKNNKCEYMHKISGKEKGRQIPCKYFKENKCRFGKRCWYLHQSPEEEKVACATPKLNGSRGNTATRYQEWCKYGDDCNKKLLCRFRHTEYNVKRKIPTSEGHTQEKEVSGENNRSKNEKSLDLLIKLQQVQAKQPEYFNQIISSLIEKIPPSKTSQ